MASLIGYKGLQIVTPEPLSGSGGQALNYNFKAIADVLESIDGVIAAASGLVAHLSDVNNPHYVTKDQIGLDAVINALQLSAGNNLSDLTNVPSARTNLGLGTSATLPSGYFAESVHIHDDRYYTESEIDVLIASASGVQPDLSAYYTKSESNLLLDDKSDVGHTHDDRYYTEVESDEIFQTKIIGGMGNLVYFNDENNLGDSGLPLNAVVTSDILADTIEHYSLLEHTHISADITDAGTAIGYDVGTAEGELPVLGTGGKLSSGVLPSIAVTDTFLVASQAAMLALSADQGDVAIRTDLNKSFILSSNSPSTLADWKELLTPTDLVSSVNGMTGTVNLTTSNINEGSNLYYTDGRVNALLVDYVTLSSTQTITGAKSLASVLTFNTFANGPVISMDMGEGATRFGELYRHAGVQSVTATNPTGRKNNIIQLGHNPGDVNDGDTAIWSQIESSWDTLGAAGLVSEWHINHKNADGSIKRTFMGTRSLLTGETNITLDADELRLDDKDGNFILIDNRQMQFGSVFSIRAQESTTPFLYQKNVAGTVDIPLISVGSNDNIFVGYNMGNDRPVIMRSLLLGPTTSDNGLQIEAPSGYAGSLIQGNVNGVTKFLVDYAGATTIGSASADAALNLFGNFTQNSHRTDYAPLSRTLPTSSVTNNVVQVGSWTLTNGGGNFLISVAIQSSGLSVAKLYSVSVQYNQQATYATLVPINNTGAYGSDDIELDAQMSNAVFSLRLRRSAGTTAGTAKISVTCYSDSTFSESSTVSTVTAPTTTFPSSNVVHLAGAETITGQKVFETGAAGASPVIFRQTGGTAGTDEVQISHNGSRGLITSKDGSLLIGTHGSPGGTHQMQVSAYNGAASITFLNTGSDITIGGATGGGLASGFFRDSANNLWTYGTSMSHGSSPANRDASIYRVASGTYGFGTGAASNSGQGQLDARARNWTVATLPTAAYAGRLGYATDTSFLYVDSGSAWNQLVDASSTQTLSGFKTFSSGITAGGVTLSSNAVSTPYINFLNGANMLMYAEKDTPGMHFSSGFALTWSSSATNANTSLDTGLARGSAGVVKVTNGSTGIGGLLAGSSTFYDDTATTGITTVTVRAGAGQGTNYILRIVRADGSTALIDSAVFDLLGSQVRLRVPFFGLHDTTVFLQTNSVRLGSGGQVTWNNNATATATLADMLIGRVGSDSLYIRGDSATGVGSTLQFQGKSSTTSGQAISSIVNSWIDSTHATRTGRVIYNVVDYNGTREFMRADATGSGVQVGIGGAISGSSLLTVNGLMSVTTGIYRNGGSLDIYESSGSGTIARFDGTNGGLKLGGYQLYFGSSIGASADIGLARSAAGILKVTNGSTGLGSLTASSATLGTTGAAGVLTLATGNGGLPTIYGAGDGSIFFNAAGSNRMEFRPGVGLQQDSTRVFGWVSNLVTNSGIDTALKRGSAGVVKVTNGSTGYGALDVGEITSNGKHSVSPFTNGSIYDVDFSDGTQRHFHINRYYLPQGVTARNPSGLSNNIVLIGHNPGDAGPGTGTAVWEAFESSWDDTVSQLLSEWHINHKNNDGTILRSFMSTRGQTDGLVGTKILGDNIRIADGSGDFVLLEGRNFQFNTLKFTTLDNNTFSYWGTRTDNVTRQPLIKVGTANQICIGVDTAGGGALNTYTQVASLDVLATGSSTGISMNLDGAYTGYPLAVFLSGNQRVLLDKSGNLELGSSSSAASLTAWNHILSKGTNSGFTTTSRATNGNAFTSLSPTTASLEIYSWLSGTTPFILTSAGNLTITGALTSTKRQTSGVVALSDGTNITTDASLGNLFTVTIAGNRTIDNPTNPVDGQKIVYRIKQDATGSRTITWGTAFRFSGGTAPTLTVTASKTDYIGFIYNGTDSKWDAVGSNLNF